MSMQCKICSHNKRLEIDREIVRSGNIAKIAKDFRVPYSSLYAHAQNHVARQLATAWEKKELDESFDLLTRIDSIIKRTEQIFKRNYDAQKDSLALKALDSQRNTIELLAKISYSLHQAKLAEVELMREQTGESQRMINEANQGRLKVLTIAELEMLERLTNKIVNQTTEIIIPEKYENKVVSTPKDLSYKPRLKRGVKPYKTILKTDVEDNVNPDLVVRKVEPFNMPTKTHE